MTLTNNAGNSPFLRRWLSLGLVLSALGGLIAFNLYVEHGHVEARERDRLSVQAVVLAENLKMQLASANDALISIRDELADSSSPSRLPHLISHLESLNSAMPGIRTLSVLDARGKVIASSRPDLIGNELGYRDYFQTVKRQPNQDMLYVSPPFKTVFGVFAFNLTRLIPAPDGGFGGVVTATLDPEYFKTLMRSVLYAPDMWDAIAHGDGQLFLIVPERKGVQGMDLAQPGSFFSRHRDSGQEASIFTGKVYATGEERMLAQRTVRYVDLMMDKPLVVAISRDLDVAFQPWRRNAVTQAALFGLIALVSAIGLYAYQRRQYRLEQAAAEARSMAERFSLALDRIPTYIYMKDRQHRYVYANRPTLDLFKCSTDELQGSDDKRFFPPDTVAHLNEIDRRVLERGEDTAEEVVIENADGSKRIYWEIKTPIYEDADKSKIWGICGISTDITDLQQQKAALQESEERFHTIFDAAPIGMALADLDGRFMLVNSALCEILGYTQEELLQKSMLDITHPDDLNLDQPMMTELLTGIRNICQKEKRYLHKDGRAIWVLLSAAVVRDHAGKARYFIMQILDISGRKALLEELEFRASTDFLTGLANRRRFIELGEAELLRAQRYGHPLSMLMIDVDRFKRINDTHGHQVGDLVLQKLGHVLREALRTIDIVGRIGGEEFAALLPETDPEQACMLAERLRETIAATDVTRETGLPLHFTVSIGIANMNRHQANLDTLLNLADKALYEAKQGGRNKVCVAA